MSEKTYEQKLAALIRMLGSSSEHEARSALAALGRLLASRSVGFTELGDAVERLATGGLEEAELERAFEAGRQQGVVEARRELAKTEAVYGQRPDGSYDWPAIAQFCQRTGRGRLKPNEQQFVDDMAGGLSFSGREPTEKQAMWLIAIFRKLGGRLK
jgi:hypothetical protein